MLKDSKIVKERARIYKLVFVHPYLSGFLLPPFFTYLAMQIFVLFFLIPELLGVFSCILPVYLSCAFAL
jgi:hypothetical protein